MQEFDDIRPYNDDEINRTILSLCDNREFVALIAGYRFPTLSRLAVGSFKLILNLMVKRGVLSRFGGIHCVNDMQALLEEYLEIMLVRTSDGFSVAGLEKLALDRSHLFLSNHRDITLDPAFTNLALHRAGGRTVRIAIGDNLLSKPWASDLMRINKSFIVRRSITKPRELLKALTKLSRYIKFSLDEERESVWIAHREGRAKDGIDKTDTAVLKMIFLGRPKGVDFSDYLRELRVVPCSIAYEFDPCIAMKARELRLRQSEQGYEKSEHEDLESIGQGIAGYKGRVHLEFSPLVTESLDNVEQFEEALDKAIISGYKLFPSNFIAYKRVFGEEKYNAAVEKLREHDLIDGMVLSELGSMQSLQKFEAHLSQVEASDLEIALQCYANAVVSKLGLLQQN